MFTTEVECKPSRVLPARGFKACHSYVTLAVQAWTQRQDTLQLSDLHISGPVCSLQSLVMLSAVCNDLELASPAGGCHCGD